jgi:hypothetical protein
MLAYDAADAAGYSGTGIVPGTPGGPEGMRGAAVASTAGMDAAAAAAASSGVLVVGHPGTPSRGPASEHARYGTPGIDTCLQDAACHHPPSFGELHVLYSCLMFSTTTVLLSQYLMSRECSASPQMHVLLLLQV